MTAIVQWQKVNNEHIAQSLAEARERLNSCDGEVLLDFSAVRRIDAAALLAFEDLAAEAEKKSVKVALRGVNVSVYKVLKLSRLTLRITFVN